jgi:phage tail-like protein
MAEFTVNPHRFDPYKNFKFLVVWEGRVVAGIQKISALKRTTEVVKNRSGGDPSTPRLSAGRTEYDAITLERGVTHDVGFDQWANKVLAVGQQLGSEQSRDFRRDIAIQLLNEAGQVALVYKVFRAWPSEYQIVSELDANANAIAIQSLKLENEGWQRDYEVPEPVEPIFTIPPS